MAQIYALAQKNINRSGYRNALDGGWLESLTFGRLQTEKLRTIHYQLRKIWDKAVMQTVTGPRTLWETEVSRKKVGAKWDPGEDTLQHHRCSCKGFQHIPRVGRIRVIRITSTQTACPSLVWPLWSLKYLASVTFTLNPLPSIHYHCQHGDTQSHILPLLGSITKTLSLIILLSECHFPSV